MFGPKGPICQSCGMPLDKDPQGGGTNTGGSRSTEYCSKCYVNGQFVNPNVTTAAQMQGLVKGKLKEMGFSTPLAWLFTRNIPSLKRWQNN